MSLPSPTVPTDAYGFWIAKNDGSQARNFLRIQLPKELPDMEAEKPVAIFQMDEGANHPGYRVYDTRTIDLSHYDFEINIGAIPATDLTWLETIYQTEKQVLISWLSGVNVLALFQPGGFKKFEYPLNIREFGRAALKFHLIGTTATAFVLASGGES